MTPCIRIKVFTGNLELYKYITTKVGVTNPECDGQTPLHIAAYFGHSKICNFLLQNVENKSPHNQLGLTPLNFATFEGHLEICHLLVQQIKKSPTDKTGIRPLHMAAWRRHFEICRLLE